MVAPAAPSPAIRSPAELFEQGWPLDRALPVVVGACTFVLLFAQPLAGLGHAWLSDPDAGQGLLLFPVALWLAWRAGVLRDAKPDRASGTLLLLIAIALRALGGLAAELFSQRFAIALALAGMVVFCWGWRQLRHWWLPVALMVLSIPLPALITNRLAIPLQFRASRMGTALIKWRHIPVRADGNVITIPGQQLFVAEACSGLRSLSALLALGVMMGGLYLQRLPMRVLLILIAIPVAVLVNGFRIFLTAFLMYFVDPGFGRGFMHLSEGWALFVVSLVALSAVTMVLRLIETQTHRWKHVAG